MYRNHILILFLFSSFFYANLASAKSEYDIKDVECKDNKGVEYCLDKQGKPVTGIVINENSYTTKRTNYENGIKEGLEQELYGDNPRREVIYKNGKVKAWREYNLASDIALTAEEYWDDDCKNSFYREYEGSTIGVDVRYFDGKNNSVKVDPLGAQANIDKIIDGIHVYSGSSRIHAYSKHENVLCDTEEDFTDNTGKITGIVRYYSKNLYLIEEDIYIDGQLVEEIINPKENTLPEIYDMNEAQKWNFLKRVFLFQLTPQSFLPGTVDTYRQYLAEYENEKAQSE